MQEIDVWISYEKAKLETYNGSNFVIFILSINLNGIYIQVNKALSVNLRQDKIIDSLEKELILKIKQVANEIDNDELKLFSESI